MKNHWLKRRERNRVCKLAEDSFQQVWQTRPDWHRLDALNDEVAKAIQKQANAEAWKAIEDACSEELAITLTSDDGYHFSEEIVVPEMPDIPEIDLSTAEIPEPEIKGFHTADKHMIKMGSASNYVFVMDTTEV